MGKIKELPRSSASLLTSSQIISSVFCVVKELVENALDAEASNIEVKLVDNGLSSIEVKDNGCGIEKNDVQFVARPHFTSKIISFSDLENVSSYGFRGEAIGAICAVANLVIRTKSVGDSVGSITHFDSSGQVLSTKPYPGSQGTTVSVLNLFKNIPVRKQYYRSEKNQKEDLHKVEELLTAYGLIQYGVRFALFHNRNLIWQKTALTSSKDALIQTFGSAIFENLKHVQYFNEKSQRKVEMYFPQVHAPPSCGFSSSSRCIVAVNKRPVRLKAVDKLLKDSYNALIHNTGRARYPVCYVSFTLPLSEVDVNIEPNKTAVMLHNSEEVFSELLNLLKDFYKTEEDLHLTSNNPEIPAILDSNSTGNPNLNNGSFLATLNSSCDKHMAKLTSIPDSVKTISVHLPAADKPMSKNDICVVGDITEPSKKKLKTDSHTSKAFNNHLDSLKSFLESSSSNSTSVASNAFNAVTAYRIPSQKDNRGLMDGNKKISDFTVNLNSHAISAAHEINQEKFPNQSSFKDTNSQYGNTAVSNTNSSNNQEPVNFGLKESNFAKDSMWSASNSEQKMISCEGKSDLSSSNLKSGVTLFNKDNLEAQMLTAAETTLETGISETSFMTSHSGDNSSKKNSVTAEIALDDEALWSRGVHPSGEIMQPVAVLQPKPIATLESIPKRLSIEKPKALKQVSLSFERKLNAFDLFCRSHRLEVAAQNPALSNQQIAQMLSEKWSTLSTEERSVYKNMLDKDYPRDVKRKEKLGKTVSQNLSQNKTDVVPCKKAKKFREKGRSTTVVFSMVEIKNCCAIKNTEQDFKDFEIINHLVPGIWICKQGSILCILNTFRLQETIIYQRLLETYNFEAEPLETPVIVPASDLGEEALVVLSNLQKDSEGNVSDPSLLANGFNVRLTDGENANFQIELLGISKCSAFYGVSDLKELLILLKKNKFSSNMSKCRPAKVLLYLQGEANRMCRQTPAIHRIQDVEDLLAQKELLIPRYDVCMHHKPFFHEVYDLDKWGKLNN